MKYLFKYVRQEPLRVLLVVILQVICSLFRVANSIFNIFILNSLVKFDFRAFVSYILLNILLFVVMTVFLFLNLVEQAKVIQLLSLHVKQDIISHISKYSVEKFNEYDTSVYSSWLTNDMNLIEGNGFGNLFQSIQIITDPLFSIIALIKFHWTFVPLILLMTVLTIFLPQLVRKQLATSNLSMTKANANVLDIINDCLRGFSTLSVFGVEYQLERRITASMLKMIKVKVHQAKISTFATCIAQVSNIIAQMLILLWTGLLIFRHMVTIGVFSSASNLSFNVFNSLAAAAPILTELRSLDPVFEKYHLNENTNTINNSNNVRVDKYAEISDPIDVDAKELQVSYQDNKSVFAEPLTFSITAGEKVAICGDSGSGKSTLLRLISGQLREYRGSLRLNKLEMQKISYSAIRDKVIYVDQSPYLFNDTIRYNLELGQKFTKKELTAALEN